MTEISETDRVERMVFELRVDARIVEDLRANSASSQASRDLDPIFASYLDEVMPDWPHWIVGYPYPVAGEKRDGWETWAAVVAVLRRLDDDR